jgi:hypothetical protein
MLLLKGKPKKMLLYNYLIGGLTLATSISMASDLSDLQGFERRLITRSAKTSLIYEKYNIKSKPQVKKPAVNFGKLVQETAKFKEIAGNIKTDLEEDDKNKTLLINAVKVEISSQFDDAVKKNIKSNFLIEWLINFKDMILKKVFSF